MAGKISDITTTVTAPVATGTLVEVEKPDGTSGKLDLSTVGGGKYEASAVSVPAAAAFTWDNQGTSTSADATSAFKLSPQIDAGQHGVYKAAPSTPYNVYMRFDVVATTTDNDGFDNNYGAGVMVRNSSNGKCVSLLLRYENAVGGSSDDYFRTRLLVGRHTTINSISSYPSTNSGRNPIKWLRVNNDGTNLTFYISVDGVNWVQHYTETLAAFIGTADQIGIVAMATRMADCAIFVHQFGTTAPSF